MGTSCLLGCRWWCLKWRLFVLSFFPLDVLDEIWDLIGSVSEEFLTSFYILSVFNEKPHSKPLERNVVYLPTTTSNFNIVPTCF